jgi:hypothetical protein
MCVDVFIIVYMSMCIVYILPKREREREREKKREYITLTDVLDDICNIVHRREDIQYVHVHC